ncbi:MAG: Flp family type IVb pilin [Boseongicola sp.]
MGNIFKRFRQDEDGAVTVDWVVLTAAIVGMGVVVITTVANGALDHSSGLNSHLLNADVTTTY